MAKPIILIVDDDPYVLQAMILRLAASGYSTVVAGTAAGALSEAQRHRPDLIILDLGLLGGGGFLAMSLLRADPGLALIPIIVVSGRDSRANQGLAIEAGAKAFLQKPVDNVELLAVIRRALDDAVSAVGHQAPADSA
jgi:DNA-binding response OmpR family regulator